MTEISDLQMARTIARAVADQGGRAYFVGGFVRDALLGIDNKDVDMEIHGLTPGALEALLDRLGQRLAIGESFGIYNLKGYGLDIAMPRKETLRGTGHKDFDIFVDPFVGTEKAAMRRDFTLNALMQDVLTGQVVDHFGGQADLQAGILRHVRDATFVEDPLRVLRAAQFAARFHLQLAPETVALCRTMDLSHLPRERVLGELQKALLKAERPSVFFEVLRQMDQLDHWFPEVRDLVGVPQNPNFHREGDVWTHTMLVLDEAAQLRHRARNPLGFMLGALTHDFGKAVTTETKDGVIHAYGHEAAGLPLADRFLHRLTSEHALIDYAKNLTLLHMKPHVAASQGSSRKSTNHLFDQALDPEALIAMALADNRGKRPVGADAEPFLRQRLDHYRQTMARPYVMGRDLIAAGLTPDPRFTQLLAHAHKLRLAGVDRDSALRQTLAYARKLK